MTFNILLSLWVSKSFCTSTHTLSPGESSV